MSASSLPMPPAIQTRLWQEAGDHPAYAILDGAQNELLVGELHAAGAPPWRCLFMGELEPDMAVVAPYLVELEYSSAFTRRLLAEGWGQNRGVFLTSETPLAALWRHLRAQVMVYGPNLDPMYFRYYDPRVLRSFLPTCTPRQLAEFFGPVGFFIAEDEEPVRAHAWSLADGQLVAQVVGP
ncbi:MAG TPA: DUF4123 domain-containing protein [Burkholderiaceae bacterium]